MNLSVSQVFNDYDFGLFGIMYCKHIFVGTHNIYTNITAVHSFEVGRTVVIS